MRLASVNAIKTITVSYCGLKISFYFLFFFSFPFNFLAAKSAGDTVNINNSKQFNNHLGISATIVKPFTFHLLYQRNVAGNYFLLFENLYENYSYAFSALVSKTQLNDTVRISKHKEKRRVENYYVYGGMGKGKYLAENYFGFVGIAGCFGMNKSLNEFEGSIDSLKNVIYFSNGYSSNTIEKHPFSIRREEKFLRSGLVLYAGIKYFFNKRISLMLRPAISLNYYYLLKTSTRFNGDIQFPLTPSKGFSQFELRHLIPYILLSF